MALSMTVATQITGLLLDIDRQIDLVRIEAREKEVAPELLQFSDGKYVMSDLLLAKSNALLALVTLESGKK